MDTYIMQITDFFSLVLEKLEVYFSAFVLFITSHIPEAIEVFKALNTPFGVLALASIIGFIVSHFNLRRAMSQNIFPGTQAVLYTTFYEPTGEINPVTGNEFHNQKMRVVHHAVDIGPIFHPSVRKRIMDALRGAVEKCDENKNFIVFQNLTSRRPFKRRRLTHLRERIATRWTNYFESQMNTKGFETFVHHPREILIAHKIFPVMINARLSRSRQIRIAYIHEAWLEGKEFPDIEDVCFENLDGSFDNNPDHVLAGYWRVNKTIINALKTDPDLYRDCHVEFYTGEKKTIPLPKI
ncbi:MAG: hypothetical protein CMH28_03665 [Micavibrio sp.]|nr:hypothetical protein [Micavibrio sp.]|tara:strand:+ start:1213 stop:2100 length:888 start_codon:yes stop_codon:yes gene_type:complete